VSLDSTHDPINLRAKFPQHYSSFAFCCLLDVPTRNRTYECVRGWVWTREACIIRRFCPAMEIGMLQRRIG